MTKQIPNLYLLLMLKRNQEEKKLSSGQYRHVLMPLIFLCDNQITSQMYWAIRLYVCVCDCNVLNVLQWFYTTVYRHTTTTTMYRENVCSVIIWASLYSILSEWQYILDVDVSLMEAAEKKATSESSVLVLLYFRGCTQLTES